jgi:hypothetical protein
MVLALGVLVSVKRVGQTPNADLQWILFHVAHPTGNCPTKQFTQQIKFRIQCEDRIRDLTDANSLVPQLPNEHNFAQSCYNLISTPQKTSIGIFFDSNLW